VRGVQTSIKVTPNVVYTRTGQLMLIFASVTCQSNNHYTKQH